MMNRSAASGILALALLFIPLPVLAQTEDDEKLEDYAEQDRRYLERYQKKEAAPAGQTPEEIEAAIFAKVEDLIRDRNYNAATSNHFRVQTDDPRINAESATVLLESFRSFFESFWDDRLELKPYEKTGRAFLFYSFYKYNQLLEGDYRFTTQRPKGHYGSMFDAITLHTDADGPGDLVDTLIHEAAHQMMDQRMNLTVGGTLPWLSEGMASYFGYMRRTKDGVFEPASVGGKGIGVYKDGKVYNSRLASVGLRSFRQAMRKKRASDSLYEQLLWIRDPNAFYGSAAELNYNASWLLVHFLFHGEEGKYAAPFVRYLRQESEGRGGTDVLMKELGLTFQALDAAVSSHASQVK